jgi:3-oxoacyl-[acyl-carrier protein] reductase
MTNVIVTGGSRGLGLAITRKLSSAGFDVIAIARHPSREIVSPTQGGAPEGRVHFRSFDLNNLSGIASLVKELRREFGAIHGLVNNAALGTSGILASMRDQQIDRLVALNVVSPITLTKHVVRSMMVDNCPGRIINIASIAGSVGYDGLSVYAATKAALIGFTRSLARELGPLGINVNAVAPGLLDTDLVGGLDAHDRDKIARRSALRRLTEVDDAADAVEFLLSDKAKNITGTVITVDAGATA